MAVIPDYPEEKIKHGAVGLPLSGRKRQSDDTLIQEISIGSSIAIRFIAVDDDEDSIIFTGPNTGEKGIRVFIGPTDPISDVPVVQQFPHHQVHEGEMHQYTYPPTALANGSNLDIRFVANNLAPTTRTPHPVIEVDSTSETWIYLYESPTFSAPGTQQTVNNRNRNSSIVPASTVWLAPTVSNVGTLLSAWIHGSGVTVGGSTRESLEWDAGSGLEYLYRLSSKAASNDVCARLIWYEDLGV